jgi:hypothetical protein
VLNELLLTITQSHLEDNGDVYEEKTWEPISSISTFVGSDLWAAMTSSLGRIVSSRGGTLGVSSRSSIPRHLCCATCYDVGDNTLLKCPQCCLYLCKACEARYPHPHCWVDDGTPLKAFKKSISIDGPRPSLTVVIGLLNSCEARDAKQVLDGILTNVARLFGLNWDVQVVMATEELASMKRTDALLIVCHSLATGELALPEYDIPICEFLLRLNNWKVKPKVCGMVLCVNVVGWD